MTQSLRQMLAAKHFIIAPGVFDGFSAMLAQRQGFDAIYMTGYGVSASRYGLPDAGLTTLSDMLGALQIIRSLTDRPIIADADTGYGGLLNVRHTVRRYEAAGANAIQIEDQEIPKKCGHTLGRRVIALADMVAKVHVAAEARLSRETLIIARTDARTAHGLDEAIARAQAYAQAGADILFVESPESEAELARIGREVQAPLVANMVPKGARTPEIPAARLQQLGFDMAIYPGVGFGAALGAMEKAYAYLKQNRVSDPDSPTSLTGTHELTGFPEVWALEKQWDARFGNK